MKQGTDSGFHGEADRLVLDYLFELMGFPPGAGPPPQAAEARFWADLTRIASEQLVLTVMARAVNRLDGLSRQGSEALAFFQQIEETNRQRNVWLLDQVDAAAQAFAAAGISAVAMKGGAFLLESRADAASWRFFGDLDFLVREDRLRDAVAILKGLGYVESGPVYHPEFHRHYPFLSHPNGQTGIDLHTRAAGLHQSALLDPDHFFDHAKVAEDCFGILIPSPEDRMAHLIVNAQILDYRYQRRLFRLRDALDFAELTSRHDIDMSQIRLRFESCGSVRPFLAYLAMMGDVLGPHYQPPADATGEGKWVLTVRKVMQNPHRARFHVIGHWIRMLAQQLFDRHQRRHLFERLLDGDQRAEFIARRLSYWRAFRR